MAEQQQSLSQQILAQNSTSEQMLTQMKELGRKSGKSPTSTPKSVEGGMRVGLWMNLECLNELGRWNSLLDPPRHSTLILNFPNLMDPTHDHGLRNVPSISAFVKP